MRTKNDFVTEEMPDASGECLIRCAVYRVCPVGARSCEELRHVAFFGD